MVVQINETKAKSAIVYLGRFGGYRSMWRVLLQKYRLQVQRNVVMEILHQVDSVSVESRRCRRLRRRTYESLGPNYIWHIDGYDKLRPYGFLISGCIDGFSRRLLWLKCAFTNHDPKVISGYYISCVDKVGGIPYRTRTDCGTENVLVAACQVFLSNRRNGHLYGTSPGNQRIEAWWSFFRHHRAQWFIDLFEDLIRMDAFHTGNIQEIECLRFCFMDVLNSDLADVVRMWNSHRIRPSSGARCPAGVPDELYFLPEDPYNNFLLSMNNIPRFIRDETVTLTTSCENCEYEMYLEYQCAIHGWMKPHTPFESVALYLKLIGVIC